MKPYHSQIKSRKQRCHSHGQIPEHPQEGCHLKTVVPVFTAFHKTVECSGNHQCHRRIVAEQNCFSIQQLLGSPVRPLRCLKLRKGRIPCFFCQLFQHPAVQDPVHCKRFQALFHSSQKLLMDQILHIKKLYHRIGAYTDAALFHLQPGIPDPLSHKGRIGFYTVTEPLLGASEDLFRFHL